MILGWGACARLKPAATPQAQAARPKPQVTLEPKPASAQVVLTASAASEEARAAAKAAAARASSLAAREHVDPARRRAPSWLPQLLERRRDLWGATLDEAQALRLQVRVTEVVPTAQGRRCLLTSSFREDAEYIYPASAIKTLGAIGALLKLQALERPELTPALTVRVEPRAITLPSGQVQVITQGGQWTLAQLIQDALIVSSNAAFNTLVEIAGVEEINRAMWSAGLSSVRLQHRLNMVDADPQVHRYSPASWLLGAAAQPVALSVERQADEAFMRGLTLRDRPGLEAGQRYMRDSGELIQGPMSMAHKNAVSLRDLERIVADIVDPTLDGDEVALPLWPQHRALLRQTMAALPPAPPGKTVEEALARFKPLSPGISRVLPRERVEYINKAGRALGFHIESAYVRDVQTDRAFFVSVALFVDRDGTLNDGVYDYAGTSFPFFVQLGEQLALELLGPLDQGPNQAPTATPK